MTTKLYLYVLLLTVGFAGGFTVNKWYNGYMQLQAVNLLEAYKQGESDVARELESSLQEMSQNERVIEKHTRTIVERDVYRIECIDDDGLRLIKAHATGDAGKLTGKSSK